MYVCKIGFAGYCNRFQLVGSNATSQKINYMYQVMVTLSVQLLSVRPTEEKKKGYEKNQMNFFEN